ncbi:hypothetical protein MLD38_028851 [Melastoma candidum]|uniref:Uncharacterized protein n=1 Tax=Melastoma candidum TaxID=119954 RepID=A0ACB9N4N3_9MYRT|nr:hypothetical protein MLD38_028851 [Melastoma candidum]
MASAWSLLLPPHSALHFTDILRNDIRRCRIPRSLLFLSPSACCGARFRLTLLNHRGLLLSLMGWVKKCRGGRGMRREGGRRRVESEFALQLDRLPCGLYSGSPPSHLREQSLNQRREGQRSPGIREKYPDRIP